MLREELWNAIVRQFPNWKEQLDIDFAETIEYYFNNIVPLNNTDRMAVLLPYYVYITDWLNDITMAGGIRTFHKPVLVNWNGTPVLCYNVKTYLMCYRGWYYVISETIQGTKQICCPVERLDDLTLVSGCPTWKPFIHALSIVNVLGKYTTKQLHNFLNFDNATDDALNEFFISTCSDTERDFNFWYAILFKQYKDTTAPRFNWERTFVLTTENGSVLVTVSKEALAVTNYIGDMYYTTQLNIPGFVWDVYPNLHELTTDWFIGTCFGALLGLHGVNVSATKMICTVPSSFIDGHKCSTFAEAISYLRGLMDEAKRA